MTSLLCLFAGRMADPIDVQKWAEICRTSRSMWWPGHSHRRQQRNSNVNWRASCRRLSCQDCSGAHGHCLFQVLQICASAAAVVRFRGEDLHVNNKMLQVLLVEDNASDARLLREMLSKEKQGCFELTHLTHMHEAEARLAKGGVDIVLLDLGLPDGHGIDILRRARAASPTVVMIVLTGFDDEAMVTAAMKEGAQDYLIKGQIESRALPQALRHAIERQRMEDETDLLRRTEVQLRDNFLSHVSHELRSPLTSIYSFNSIIADGLAGQTTPKQDEYLQIILRNVAQLRAMVDDLLELTRERTGKLTVELQPVSINEAAAYAVDTVRGAAKQREINLSFLRSACLPSAYADAIRVRQILTILLDNAVKFTPVGGTVTIEAREYEKDGSMVLVEVSDTGCGIKAEEKERIFEHLYQVADRDSAGRRGLGLGLHIAKDLVTRQGGEIWATSVPGKGSRFSFTLPTFSLASLIRPILAEQNGPGDLIALFVAHVECQDGSPAASGKALDVTRKILQECLRADTSVLLPSIGPAGEHKIFFVVANTQQRGAEIIENRVLKRIGQEFQSGSFNVSVSHVFLPPMSREANESMETFAERAAAEVRDQINNPRVSSGEYAQL
jgi:signal transduction histidine kinase